MSKRAARRGASQAAALLTLETLFGVFVKSNRTSSRRCTLFLIIKAIICQKGKSAGVRESVTAAEICHLALACCDCECDCRSNQRSPGPSITVKWSDYCHFLSSPIRASVTGVGSSCTNGNQRSGPWQFAVALRETELRFRGSKRAQKSKSQRASACLQAFRPIKDIFLLL